MKYERNPPKFCSDVCRAKWHKAKPKERELVREERAKEIGQEKALERYGEDAERAARETVLYLARHGTCIVSDIRTECERKGIRLAWHRNWVGGLFTRCKWFVPTGEYRKAYHKGSRARLVRVYRLSDEGRRALEKIG